MEFLRRMGFKWKLVLMITIPLVCLAWFTTNEVRNASNLNQETESILRLAELSVISSTLVHELQKERGMSAGYLGSGGKKFVTKLPEQRILTDERASQFKSGLESVKGKLGTGIDTLLQNSLSDLQALEEVRENITQLKMSVSEEVAIYTAMNKRLIDVIAYLPRFSSVGDVNNRSTAYVNFIQSKERAGIERAVLAATFAKDQFVEASFLKLNKLIVEQDTYFNVFRSLATEKQLTAFSAMFKEVPFVEADRMRSTAIKKADTGGFGIDPEVWFSVQTQKINLLKQFEADLSENLVAHVSSVNQSAATAYQNAMGATVISVLVSIAVGWVMFSLIQWQLGTDPERLRLMTYEIAHDNLDVSFGGEDRKLTGVYASLRTMRDKLRDQILAEREAAAGENARIKRALDNASNKLMLTDADLNVQYMNKAMEKSIKEMGDSLLQITSSLHNENLLKQCIEHFSTDASNGATGTGSVTTVKSIDLSIGDRTISVVISPVQSEDGCNDGTVVEWQDRTEQVVTEKKIRSIIDCAKVGDLGHRIDVSKMHGFFAYLSQSVNELLDETERAVSDTGVAIAAMARGDLTSSITSNYSGSFGQLKDDVNATIGKLTEVVQEISNSADLVTRRSDEISDGTSTVSERTEMQAANLQETAASMEQMTSIVRQNANNALQANQLAAQTRKQAEEGGHVVNEAIEAMSEITESSNRIAAIIGVIDEIAFQTNLLALNAAVEAARAGEQGQGFAVVANEVRNLAGRSANAAKEIKELIAESVDKIQSGSKLVGNSGKTLEEIVVAVKQVVEIVDNITSASQEQSQGIDQVNRSVAQIDEVTQENSGMIEETANASKAMRDQAKHLKDMVGFFSTESTSGFGDEPVLKVAG